MAGQRPGLGRKISDDNALGGTTRNIKNISNFVEISAYFIMRFSGKTAARPLHHWPENAKNSSAPLRAFEKEVQTQKE